MTSSTQTQLPSMALGAVAKSLFHRWRHLVPRDDQLICKCLDPKNMCPFQHLGQKKPTYVAGAAEQRLEVSTSQIVQQLLKNTALCQIQKIGPYWIIPSGYEVVGDTRKRTNIKSIRRAWRHRKNELKIVMQEPHFPDWQCLNKFSNLFSNFLFGFIFKR
jgi:hypothetical protein